MLKYNKTSTNGGKTIVLTGGGTAGHVLPNFALLPYLRKHFEKIYYIGSTDGIEKQLVDKQGLEYFGVTCVKLRRGLNPKSIAKNLAIPFKLIKGVNEAKKLMRKLKPDVVFSKGGFVGYPVVKAAASCGVPVVAHESDMTMGLANKMSAKYCKKICTTFEQTAKGEKFICTGSPIRQRVYEGSKLTAGQKHNMTGERNLLVIGGSLGASKINATVREVAPALLKKYNIIHICGKGKTTQVDFDNYVQLEYVDDIENYLAWADVVISRAGSNALCELMVLGKAVLFIPLSTGRGDQLDNVKEVLRHDACEVIYEQDLTNKTLTDALEDVWLRRDKYSRNAQQVVYDGSENILEVILQSVQN